MTPTEFKQARQSLDQILRAGRVRRWHSNPDLSHVDDSVEAHAGRVAKIIAYLWPDASADLLRMALRHDDGEVATGDVSGEFKRLCPDMASMLSQLEAVHRVQMWGRDPVLTDLDAKRLDLADKLDAYLFAARHAPEVMGGDGWPEARDRILAAAYALGVIEKLETV